MNTEAPSQAALPYRGFYVRAAILLGLEVAFILFIAAWQRGLFIPIPHPTSSDFVSFHAAGLLTLQGQPWQTYDQAAHYLAQQQIMGAVAPYQFFFYPPIYLLLCSALATLPYFVAYALFQGATLAAFLATLRSVLGRQDWRFIVPVLAFPAVFWNIGVGQNAFLTAALFAGFTLTLNKRPILAGLLLGLVCYKPHFGLIAPFALIAGGHWRAIGSATVTVVGLAAFSWFAFGAETWTAYLAAAADSGAVYASGRIDLAGMVTIFGAARLLGLSTSHAWMAQVITAIAMIGLTMRVWQRTKDAAPRYAALVCATLLAVPMALVYDQLLLLVAMAWIARDGLRRGFLPAEVPVLVAAYLLSVLIWPIGTSLAVPIAPIIHLGVLTLAVRRAGVTLPGRCATLPQPEAQPAT